MKKFNIEIFSFILIFSLSFFLAISYSFHQVAIDSGLSLSDKIFFPPENNIFFYYANNSWSLVIQFIQFLISLEFDISLISKIILFLSTFFYSLGIYLTSKNISSSSYLALLIVFFVMVFRKNFGDIDYPTLMFSEHTNGMISLSLITLVFGLSCNRNFFSASFLIGLLISIHLTLGLWIFFIFFLTTIFFLKKKDFSVSSKRIAFGLISGIFVTIISFIFYKINLEPIPYNFNISSYTNYMNNWDAHRNFYGNLSVLNYEYIFKSTLLFFALILYLNLFSHKKGSDNKFFSYLLILNILISFILYLAYKKIPSIFPDLATRTIPSRYFLLQSVIGYPILISLTYLFLNKILKKFSLRNERVLGFFIFLVIFYFLSHYKNVNSLIVGFSNNFFSDTKVEDETFWQKVKNNDTSGYIITSELTCSPTIAKANKPVILCPHPIDYIPYLPKLAGRIEYVMKEIYEITFENPPKEFNGIVDGLRDVQIKEVFENREKKNWLNIAKTFNAYGVIVPANWSIDLDPHFTNEKYTFYKIN